MLNDSHHADVAWDTALDKAVTALWEGSLDLAEDLLREATSALAAFGPDDLRRAETFRVQADVAWHRRDPAAILSARMQQVAIIKRAQGEAHPDYAEALLDLADAYYGVKNLDMAFSLLMWTLDVFERVGEAADGLRAGAMDYAASIAAQQAEAEEDEGSAERRQDLLNVAADLHARSIPLLEELAESAREEDALDNPLGLPAAPRASSESPAEPADRDAQNLLEALESYADVLRALGRTGEADDVDRRRALFLRERGHESE